jgi:hypothetical protein
MPAVIWERREHGDRCRYGSHLEYRTRTPSHVQINCKLCRWVSTELYEHSFLNRPVGEEIAA